MLNIKNLSYRYQSRTENTLKNINLHLNAGEMLLLAGRSGCGKSTLIKAISGLLGSDGVGELSGRIYLAGQDTTRSTPEALGQLVGTVYQSPDDQLFAMTVADEVGFALENQGADADYIRQEVRHVLKLVGLAGFENYSIHQLSGGQRQRLALASILITKPRLLILDEPVSQMNPQGVQSFLQLLVRLNKEEGIAILMIEHRVNELCTYFERLAIMQAGEIIYDGAMQNAWDALTGRESVGVREPQNVKLCRALDLQYLSAETANVLEQIKKQCTINASGFTKNLCINTQAVPTIVAVQNLFFTYPGAKKPTLKNLSFTIKQGEILGLMGFNGAGKSTLLNILGGLAQEGAGSVLFEGSSMQNALGKLGYLRQEPDLMLLADTVAEEIAWQNKAISAEEVTAFLKRLDLEVYRHDFPLALSKGQRLRLVLGAMLAKRPHLLLLDEPTTGQDEQSLAEIKRLLLEYRAQGGCVFICTHDVELAAEVADRIIVLKQGEILAEDSANAILSNAKLLQEGGLTASTLLDISQALAIPPCVTVKEVQEYVR